MRGKKRKQQSQYVGDSTLPPELMDVDENHKNIHKRLKTTYNGIYMPFFVRSMEITFSSLIKNKTAKSDGKNLQKNLKKLKEDLTNRKTLPPGTLQTAVGLANETIAQQTGEKSFLTTSAYKNRLDNESAVLLIDLWNKFATEEKIDTIVNQKLSNVSVNSSNNSISATSFTNSDTPPDYRTCSVSLNKIVRKNLEVPVRMVVGNKLMTAMKNSSDLHAYTLAIVQMLMIVFRNNKIVIENGTLNTQAASNVDFTSILPLDFVAENHTKPIFSAPPLSEDIKKNHHEELASLFTDQHLHLIMTYYCGEQGSKEENLKKRPLQYLLFNKLASEGLDRGSLKQNCKSEEMGNVFTQVATNIKNMWSTNTIFQKLLDRLLLVLIRLHLASNRAAKYRKNLERKTTIKAHSGSNHKRNVLYSERKKLEKLARRLGAIDLSNETRIKERVNRSRERIRCFESLPKAAFSSNSSMDIDILEERTVPLNNPSEEDKMIGELEQDISRARIFGIKSITKHLLLSQDIVSEELIKDRLYKPTEREMATIKLIVLTLKPSMPKKEDRFTISHQLPFCILANDILSVIDQKKFVRKLSSEPAFFRLQSLELNSTALYQILTSQPEKLNIAAYDDFQIDSIDFARSNAAAVFNSIFDLAMVNETCGSHGLTFAHHIKILPGMKTARLLGVKLKSKGIQEDYSAPSSKQRILTNTSLVEESKKELGQLQLEIKTLEASLEALQNNLKTLLKTNEHVRLSAEIKSKRLERKECTFGQLKETLTHEINWLKDRRFLEYKNIQTSKKELSDLRQSIYFRRMAIRFYRDLRKTSFAAKPQNNRQELLCGTIGLFKASECRIPNPKSFVFSRTDNGIVNMSRTTAFTLDRFKFHLKLYNKYQVLGDSNIENDRENDKYLDLPKDFVINTADLDFGCGFRRARKKLENEKKLTLLGNSVLEAEKSLSKEPLHMSLTIQEYLKNSNTHVYHSSTIREFYGSSKRAIKLRTLEIQKKKFTNKLVSKEKKFIKNTEKKKVVQFVGDRGTGVGSRIKGFRRYGEKWLEVLRSNQNAVCITNEHNTSQLCVYCFEKCSHPRCSGKRVTKGALQCLNPACVSVKAGKAIKSRDALASLSIGLSGLSCSLLGVPIPHYSPEKISHFDTETFKNLSSAFVKEEHGRQ